MTQPSPLHTTEHSAIDDVGVVVLSYGPSNSAQAVIDELCGDGLVDPAHIIEIHNPSAPGERVEPSHGHRVLNLGENVGYAGGMNAGIAQLDGRYRYILLLTHDVRITGAGVAALRAALAEHPEVAMVGPLLTAGGQVWSAGKRRLSDWRFLHLPEPGPGEDVQQVDSLDGSVLMVRSADLKTVRFDPRFFMYFEETDLIERLRAGGAGMAAVVGSARAESAPGAGQRPFSNAYLMARNGLYVAGRHGGAGAGLRFASSELKEGVKLITTASRTGVYTDRRAFAARRLLVKIVGMVDCLRRRFGPPPASLRDGDLRV